MNYLHYNILIFQQTFLRYQFLILVSLAQSPSSPSKWAVAEVSSMFGGRGMLISLVSVEKNHTERILIIIYEENKK